MKKTHTPGYKTRYILFTKGREYLEVSLVHAWLLHFLSFLAAGKTHSTLNPGRDPHPNQLAKSARRQKFASESRIETRQSGLDLTDDDFKGEIETRQPRLDLMNDDFTGGKYVLLRIQSHIIKTQCPSQIFKGNQSTLIIQTTQKLYLTANLEQGNIV